MKSRIVSSLGIDAQDEFISPGMAQVLQQRLPKCSMRWLQASATLWSLVICDSQRAATQTSLSQFLDVMTWRAHDKITAEEFSVLHAEWMQHAGSVLDQQPHNSNNNSTSIRSPPSSNNAKHRSQHQHHQHHHKLPLNIFRALLLEKRCADADVDLFIGLLLNEVNLKLLHSTIAYHNHNNHNQQQYKLASSLSVVTHRWLQLTEELFFAIDLPGTLKLLF